ncbi:MAG TPA: CAP domain-containing protein [Phycisphaerae bacterium]|nr:CAP domain-containing protein [Phycisphaerae bacterium]
MKHNRLPTRTYALLLAMLMSPAGCSTQINLLATPPGLMPQTTNPPPPKEKTPPAPPRPQRVPTDCRDLGEPAGPYQLAMFRLVNDYRERKNLSTLRYSRTLELAANRYAERMYREDFFSHNAPDGSVPGDRAVDAGYCDPIVGENIAYGMNKLGSAAEAMMNFMDSPHHDENMRLKRWRYAGIGFFKVKSRKGTEYWWVQLFGMDVPENAILPPPRNPKGKNRTAPGKQRGRSH